MILPTFLISLIVLAAATLQGFSGFGFGLVFMGLASLLINTTHASIVGAVLALTNTLFVLWSVRRSLDLRKIKAFFVGGAFGLPVGVWGLASLDARWLTLGLGLVLIGFCSYSLLNPPKSLKPWPQFLGYPLGVIAGVLGGALNIAGPPIIIYSYYQPWDKDSIKASLVAYFAVLSTYKTILLIVTHMMTQQILLEAAAAIPVQILGATIGIRLSGRCNKDQVRRAAFMILIVLGILLLIRA